MRIVMILLSIYFVTSNAVFANAQETKPDSHKGFLSIINNHKELLSESSQCIGLLSKNDKTIGDLLASFLAWPSTKLDDKYFVSSQCNQSKREIGKGINDTLDCSLTVTEEITPLNSEPVHIIATMRFSIDKNNHSLIKNTLSCY